MSHAHYTSTRVSAEAHTHAVKTPLLFHVVPGDSPYQIVIVSETGAAPHTTTALDRQTLGGYNS